MKNVSVGKIIAFGLLVMVNSSLWACVDNALDNEANFENCKQQALTGDADAYFQLGKFFSQGRVVAQDYSRALENFQTAAEKGSPEAPYFLSNFYLFGKGVKKDYRQVYGWRHIAGVNGYSFGYMSRDQITKKMKGTEISQAKQWVQDWLAEYRKPKPVKVIKPVIKKPVAVVVDVEVARAPFENIELVLMFILGVVLVGVARSSGAREVVGSTSVTGVERYIQEQAGKTRVERYLDIQKSLER
jgi:hypothetical protein